MTSQSPRIYTYKITFEEVPYYYYGVHKEKRFDEDYWGSSKTHKWMWNFYTPKKQILQVFEYNDNGYIVAQEVEKRIIKPIYNTDKWCLNENVGGIVSLKINRQTGKKVGLKHYENKTGFFSLTLEERRNISKKNGLKHYENKTGMFSLTEEERKEINRKTGLKNYENKIGIFSRTKEEMVRQGEKNGLLTYQNKTGIHGLSFEQRSMIGKKNGLNAKENKTGICGLTSEKRTEYGKRGGTKSGIKHKENGTGICGMSKEKRSENAKKVNSQKWECLETGFITNPGSLTRYQKARDIDTSKRKRIA